MAVSGKLCWIFINGIIMEKNELVKIISEILIPIGFKKKGNYWIINGDAVTKMVNLQKSQFSNSFYINYGYILKSIPIDNEMMHIYNRVTSADVEERNRLKELLNLENNISNAERSIELKQLILDKLVTNIQSVNTEEDLLNDVKRRPHLNDIPLIVKKHFDLELE